MTFEPELHQFIVEVTWIPNLTSAAHPSKLSLSLLPSPPCQCPAGVTDEGEVGRQLLKSAQSQLRPLSLLQSAVSRCIYLFLRLSSIRLALGMTDFKAAMDGFPKVAIIRLHCKTSPLLPGQHAQFYILQQFPAMPLSHVSSRFIGASRSPRWFSSEACS